MAVQGKRKPNACAGALEYQIEGAIFNIARKLYRMAKPQYTASELIKIFVDPDRHRSLTEAFLWSKGAMKQHTMSVNVSRYATGDYTVNGKMNFTWGNILADGFFPEDREIDGPHERCPDELREKFERTARAMVKVAHDWGLVRYVFQRLNEACSTPQQVRFVWPSLVELLRQSPSPVQRSVIEKLTRESTRAGDRARVPPEINDLIKPSYEIVTKSIFLLEHDPPDQQGNKITYNLTGIQIQIGNVRFGGQT